MQRRGSTSSIRTVEVFALPYRESNDHDSTRYSCLVRIEDSEGCIGWGEAATITEEAALATAILTGGYGRALSGSPADPAAAAGVVRRHGWWHGGAGIASFAASAIDMALWDLAGHRQGVTVAQLLGADPSRSLPTVLTCHASLADLDELAETLAGWVQERGSHGIKVAFGKAGSSRLGVDVGRDIDFISKLRGRLGPASRIMVDVAPSLEWTVEDAVSRLEGMRPYHLTWIEEPLGARDERGYRALREQVGDVLIAYGEREWSPRGVHEILATGTVDVVGLDPGRVEGISGFLLAASDCAQHGVTANAHAFAGPLIYAASLAASLASDACEEFEIAPLRNELFELVGHPGSSPASGRVEAPTGHGLGVEVDEAAVRRASSAFRSSL